PGRPARTWLMSVPATRTSGRVAAPTAASSPTARPPPGRGDPQCARCLRRGVSFRAAPGGSFSPVDNRLVVEAPTVVVACGGIESPALLLRSGIGGPAAGKHLHLHPATVVEGFYEEPIDGWSGQIQSALSDAFE